MKDYIVINEMADGSICKDLSTYIDDDHPLPDLVARTMLDMILAGRAIREKREAEAKQSG